MRREMKVWDGEVCCATLNKCRERSLDGLGICLSMFGDGVGEADEDGVRRH